MSYADQVNAEINTILDKLADDGKPWLPGWIANTVCTVHEDALGPETEHTTFWRYAGYTLARKLVGECITRRAGPAVHAVDDKDEPRLPGFEHARAYYAVKRGDEIVGVHILQLTEREFSEKIAMLRKRAITENAHADELERIKRLIHCPKTDTIGKEATAQHEDLFSESPAAAGLVGALAVVD